MCRSPISFLGTSSDPVLQVYVFNSQSTLTFQKHGLLQELSFPDWTRMKL